MRRATKRCSVVLLGCASLVMTACSSPLAGLTGDADGPWDAPRPAGTSSTGTPGSTATGKASAAPDIVRGGGVAVGPVPAGLDRFYAQRVVWFRCPEKGAGIECSNVEVPFEYGAAEGQTLTLPVQRRMTGPGQARGAVVLVGHPGHALAHSSFGDQGWVSDWFKSSFDLYAVELRSPARKPPIKSACFSRDSLRQMMIMDPTPVDLAAASASAADLRSLYVGCLSDPKAAATAYGPGDMARDLDIIRSVLGMEQINLMADLQMSWPVTHYLARFPGQVGRVVLDAGQSMHPDVDAMAKQRASALESATAEFVRYCIRQQDCPLGESQDKALRRLAGFLNELDAQPLTSTREDFAQVGEGVVRYALNRRLASFSTSRWDECIAALREAMASRSADRFVDLAKSEIGYDEARIEDNPVAQMVPLACSALPPAPSDPVEAAALASELSGSFPVWGAAMGWSTMAGWPLGEYISGSGCPGWPTPADLVPVGQPQTPVLLLTPAGGAFGPQNSTQRLSTEIRSVELRSTHPSSLALWSDNSCIDDAVRRYLTDAELPAPGTQC